MKSRIILSGMLLSAALTFQSAGGTLFYVPIPAVDSDAQSGIDAAKGYTNAVAAGTAKERTVNGVTFAPLSGAENVTTVNGVTLSAATGMLANGGGKAESILADGAMARLFSGMIFNDGAADNSEQYVVLDPASLTAGRTYDFRVYIANATGENRQVNLSFAGDGKPAVNTDFFNEDDATTSAGGFVDPNQAYYINYRFTWDGVSTPGFTATQRFGNTPFVLFALTNHEVGGDLDVQPAGAMVQVAPEPIAAPPKTRSSKTISVDYEEDIGVSSDVFYSSDTLRRHGRWVTVGSYGRCWQPSNVDDDWEPYTRGRWVHSRDDGWVWDSDEDFGWATYHYGRWFREEDTGWCWVPGKVWGPGWVSWRHGHSHVGWAPLPPAALVVAGIGISTWADHRWGMGPRSYNFVNARDFGAPSMARVLIPRQQNALIMASTNNVTNLARTPHGLFNGGPSFHAVNNAILRSGMPGIPTVSVNRHIGSRPVTPEGKFSHLSDGVLSVAAPTVVRTKRPTALPPIAATIPKPRFDKGWNGIADPNRATALQAKIASEIPGTRAKIAPARLPGTIPTAAPAIGIVGKNELKSFRNGKPAGTALVQPGMPSLPGSVNPLRPGVPMAPAAATPALPGQPPITIGSKGRRGENPTVPNIPVVRPSQPIETPPLRLLRPGQPAQPGMVAPPMTVPPAIQPTLPPSPKSETGRSTSRTRQPEPRVPSTILKPTAPPVANPAIAPMIKPNVPNDPPRSRKITPPTAPTNPAPIQAPMIRPAPTPEPARIQKRIPQPTAPISAPRVAPVHPPAPIRVPEPVRIRPQTPPPAAPMPAPPRRIERPAPPAPIPPRYVPPPVAPPRPAPVFIQPRPAPPMNIPLPPAAPMPAPGRGGLPTPILPPGFRR